jgi:[ribosomal protein S5]-alanine N-acetyltransferase
MFANRRTTLRTGRLVLQPLTGADLDALHRVSNDPLVRRYLWDDEPVPRTAIEDIIAQSVRGFVQRGLGLFGIRLRGEEEILGFCGFLPLEGTGEIELAYELVPDWWGRGLASEAARECLRYAFEEVGLGRVVAGADPPNVASLRVLDKLGMKPIGEIAPDQPGIPYFAISRATFLDQVEERE